MRKLSGFSLMEMMIVMLIVAVVAAASAPMINKKMLQDQANVSPWVWTGADNSIAYNLKGIDTQAAVIGGITVPKIEDKAISKLHIVSDGTHISLKKKNSVSDPFLIKANDESILLSSKDVTKEKSVVIGYGAQVDKDGSATVVGHSALGSGTEAVAIGYDAEVLDQGGTSLGSYTSSNGMYATAIGLNTSASNNNAIAIGGFATEARGINSIAIGGGTSKEGDHALAANISSIAIGYNAQARGNQAIAIGGATLAKESVPAIASSNFATAIGAGAKAAGMNSIAIGYGTSESEGATGLDAIAIGTNASAGENSIALGSSAVASDNKYAIAIGKNAAANHNHAIAIGGSNDAGTAAIGDGYMSIAIGYDAWAEGGTSIAIGQGASTGESSGNSIAIGAGATVGNEYTNSVAIGAGATANQSNQIVLGDGNATVYIKGNLVVDKNVLLGRSGYKTSLYATGRANGTTGIRTLCWSSNYDAGHHAEGSTSEFAKKWISSNSDEGSTSDRRLKNVGEAFKGGLAEIKKLEVFNYTFKKDPDKTPRVGVMAQDLEKIFPKAVFKGDDGFLRIRMEDMFYALVNAVKELDAKINLLEQKQKKIDELEKRVEKLEKRLEKLEKGK